MKKSLIAFLAAALMAASLAGCQNTPDNSSSGSSSAGTTTSASSTVPQITEDLRATPLPFRKKRTISFLWPLPTPIFLWL